MGRRKSFTIILRWQELHESGYVKCPSIRVSRGFLESVPVLPPFLTGGGLLILDWVIGMEKDGYGQGLCDCTFLHIVTTTISGAVLLGLNAENPPLYITACTEWRYTLWTWKIIRLRNCRWVLGICYWSCLVWSWILRSGGSLGTERILRRSEIT